MKKLQKTISGVLAMLFAFSLVACVGGEEASSSTSDSLPTESESSSGSVVDESKIDYATYGSYWLPQHDYKTMPVGAYNSCPPAKYGYTKNFLVDEEIFKAYYAAGVNMIMGLTDYVGMNLQDVMTALDYCYDYDMGYLLAYTGAINVVNEGSVRSTLASVKYHDSFAGIMHCDEPGYVMYERIAASRKVFEKVLDDTSEKLYHVNLFPSYANQKQLWFRSYTADDVVPDSTYDYQRYVDDYMRICTPQVLSYDFYPIQGQFPKLSGGYFENMSLIRKAAMEANVPFWVYVQTCTFSSGQRLPTQADLDWNVNTCLAYGTKGIQYFCGVQPQDGGEKFTGSMFDVNGNKTEVYDRVLNTDKMIAAVDEVLMCSKSKGLIVAGVMPQLNQGEERMTIPAEDVLESYNELTSVTANHALVGCFDYNGKTALYVVNNAIADDTIVGCSAQDNVTLNFNANVRGYTLDTTGKKEFSGSSVSAALDAGKAILVVLE